MIAFKTHTDIFHWHLLHPKLIELIHWVDERWWGWSSDHVLVVTSAWRRDGVHGCYRALDIRLRYGGVQGAPFFSRQTQEKIEREINQWWDYGKDHPITGRRYPVALVHGEGDNLHLHLQVRNETTQRSFA
jgi:hypothetical protein